jgi:hypothetical protein
MVAHIAWIKSQLECQENIFRSFKGRVSNEPSSRYQRTRLAHKSERGYRVNRTNGTRACKHTRSTTELREPLRKPCQENILVQLQLIGWDLNKVFSHEIGLVPGGLSFQRKNILPPNLGKNSPSDCRDAEAAMEY